LDGLLQRGLNLNEEIAAGNIFLINYEILDGINTGTYEGKQLQLAVPFCLLYLRPNNELVPIAIQLTQGIFSKKYMYIGEDLLTYLGLFQSGH
jgi:hypothetical protein